MNEYTAPLMPVSMQAMVNLEWSHRAALANGGCDRLMRIVGDDGLFCGIDGLCPRCAPAAAACPPMSAPLDTEQTAAQMFAALAVLVRTTETHAWLTAHDPMALRQAKAAMLAYGTTYGFEQCSSDVVGI